MEDAYNQLQNLKFDLQKIRQVQRDLVDQESSEDSDQDENVSMSENGRRPIK